MKRFNRIISVGTLAVVASFIAWGGDAAQAQYTKADVYAAAKEHDKLLKIAADKNTPDSVRITAFNSLPISRELLALAQDVTLPRLLQKAIPDKLFEKNLLTVADMPSLIAFEVSRQSYPVLWSRQNQYVQLLLKAGEVDKALSESKRLIGISPIHPQTLLQSVNLTALALRNDALKKGVSPKEAVATMNAYLEAVNNKTVASHPFTAQPFPAAPPEIVALEKSDNLQVSSIALLYSGKYDAANTIGEKMFAASTDAGAMEFAFYVMGAAANGKAGLPDAANALLE